MSTFLEEKSTNALVNKISKKKKEALMGCVNFYLYFLLVPCAHYFENAKLTYLLIQVIHWNLFKLSAVSFRKINNRY